MRLWKTGCAMSLSFVAVSFPRAGEATKFRRLRVPLRMVLAVGHGTLTGFGMMGSTDLSIQASTISMISAMSSLQGTLFIACDLGFKDRVAARASRWNPRVAVGASAMNDELRGFAQQF